MGAKRQRRTIEPDFKREAVRLVAENPDRTKAEIARQLGVDPKVLYTWINEATKHGANAFPGPGNTTDEVIALRRELKLVTQERDILKNAILNSIGQCNVCRKYFSRSFEAECLAWTLI